MFGPNGLNVVQLVPQGPCRWIGLQSDHIEQLVFPVFKLTYGSSKVVAVRLLCLLYLNFRFKSDFAFSASPGAEGDFKCITQGCSLCKFPQTSVSKCGSFPMVPYCMVFSHAHWPCKHLFVVTFILFLEKVHVTNEKNLFEIILLQPEASQSSLFHSVHWCWILWLDLFHLYQAEYSVCPMSQ